MRTLYHWPLDPQSRQARVALAEKNLRFKLEPLSPWAVPEDFLAIAPEGTPPVLIDDTSEGRLIIAGARAIGEYCEDSHPKHPLMPETAKDKAETRRLCQWFDDKFDGEVNAYILHEKIEKSLNGGEAPHPPTLRQGREHLRFHLDYLGWLFEDRPWLAGDRMSLADIAAGANISVLDFLGEISWATCPNVKDWYQKLKSRPSFRPLLADRLPGLTPPRHYTDLDF